MLSELLSERKILEGLLVGMDDNDPRIDTVGNMLNKNSLEIIAFGRETKKKRFPFAK